jgi:hypothetical protein
LRFSVREIGAREQVHVSHFTDALNSDRSRKPLDSLGPPCGRPGQVSGRFVLSISIPRTSEAADNGLCQFRLPDPAPHRPVETLADPHEALASIRPKTRRLAAGQIRRILTLVKPPDLGAQRRLRIEYTRVDPAQGDWLAAGQNVEDHPAGFQPRQTI